MTHDSAVHSFFRMARALFCAATMLTFVTLHIPAVFAQDADLQAWVGEWKSADPNVQVNLSIDKVDAAGVHILFDEGVGMNGLAFDTLATRTGDEAHSKGDCSLALKLKRGAKPVDRKIETALTGECGQMSEVPHQIVFVPQGAAANFKAGFDCAKAATPIEKLVCANRELAAGDLALTGRYGALRKSLDKEQVAALQASQREWVKARNTLCGEKTPDASCLRRMYGVRRLALAAWPVPAADAQWNPRFEAIRAIVDKKGSPLDEGLRDFLTGWFTTPEDGGVDDMEFEAVNAPPGLHWIGCSVPDPSKSFDPQGQDCGRTAYVGILPNDQIWRAFAQKYPNTRVIYRPYGAAAEPDPAALAEFRRRVGKAFGPCEKSGCETRVNAPQSGAPPSRP